MTLNIAKHEFIGGIDIIIAGRQAVTHEFWDSERDNYNLYVSLFVHDECERGDSVLAGRRMEVNLNK